MSKSDIQPEFMIGEEPPPDLLEHTHWARRVIAGDLEAVHDTLSRLVTLTAALLGGATVALGHLPVSPMARTIVVALLFAAMGFSLWGSLPWSRKVNPAFPLEAQALRTRLARAGMRWVWATVLCIFFGFAVLVGNLIAVWH
jgi:hypothetical protein